MKNEIVAADRAGIFSQLYQRIASGSNKEAIEHVLASNHITPEEALYISVEHARANTEEKSITVAESLLSQFTDLDINSQFGKREWTALHKACTRMSSSEMIKLLIDKS